MFRSETALVACSTIFRNWDKQLSVMPVYRPQPSEPGTFVARLRSNMVVNAARRATVVLVFVGIGVSIVIVRFWRPLTIDACVLQPPAPKASSRHGGGMEAREIYLVRRNPQRLLSRLKSVCAISSACIRASRDAYARLWVKLTFFCSARSPVPARNLQRRSLHAHPNRRLRHFSRLWTNHQGVPTDAKRSEERRV